MMYKVNVFYSVVGNDNNSVVLTDATEICRSKETLMEALDYWMERENVDTVTVTKIK